MVETILPLAEAGEGIEQLSGMLSPGFINCHCHLELSHMKGMLPESTGLVDFLLAVMQRRFSGPPSGELPEVPAFILDAIADAEESMLRNGIVAIGDICNTTHTLAQKKKGRLYYHNFIETMGFIAHSAPDRFENSRKIFDAFEGMERSLVPHAPYSVSSRLFGLIADFPDNRLLTIHNQESEAENEFYLTGGGDFLKLYQAMGLDVSFFTGTGKRSLESYLPYFRCAAPLILVHNVATNEEDLRFAMSGSMSPMGPMNPTSPMSGPRLFFCLCPNANQYISGMLPDVELLIRHNCAIVIGTDSLASNHQLDILEELKTLQRQFPRLPASILLQWATSNGAEALQVEDRLGSFDSGKKPGVVLIEGMEEGGLTAGSRVRRLV